MKAALLSGAARPAMRHAMVAIAALLLATGPAVAQNCNTINRTCTGVEQFDATLPGVINGPWTFWDDSQLNAMVPLAVSADNQVFRGNSRLNVTAPGAIIGGLQYFYENSHLDVFENGTIHEGLQDFHDNSQLNLYDAGAIVGGFQGFYGFGQLNIFDAGTISGGVQFFQHNAELNAMTAGAVSGGEQWFYDGSRLNAAAANAVTGGQQSFISGAELNASAMNAVSGGTQRFGFAQLNALVTGAVSGGTIRLYEGGIVQVLAENALTNGARIEFDPDGWDYGILQLNGFSTTIGQLDGPGHIWNGGADAAVLTVDSSVRGDSEFSGFMDDGGAGALGLVKTGAGKFTLSGFNSYTGPTLVNGGTLEVNGSIISPTTVNAGGTLSGVGSVGSTVLNAGGIIAPGTTGPGGSGSTIGQLTIDGDFTGNGGILSIQAVLGDDSSATDLLRINGDSLLGLAPTRVQVTNLGGLGAETVDGIKIVDVLGAVSDVGAFVLNGPAIGGAYSYKLFQNDLGGLDGDWYLRNTGVLSPTTPTFENYPVALLGMVDLPTLRQRVGSRTEIGQGVWTRIEGGGGHHEASGSSTGASYDSSQFLAQIGLDSAVSSSAEGALMMGVTAQYGSRMAQVSSSFGDGSNLTESLGLGASLTWHGSGGTYLDLQGQLATFRTDLNAVGYTLVEDNVGGGFAVSLEAGHAFDLDDNWSLTPQAQLSYGSVHFDDFVDHFGSAISLEQGQSLLGRVGLALDHTTQGVDGHGQAHSSTLYGVVNLTYEFLDGATVLVSGTDLRYSGQKFGAELGLGGTVQWGDGARVLHGQLIGSSSFEGSYALKGTLGLGGRF